MFRDRILTGLARILAGSDRRMEVAVVVAEAVVVVVVVAIAVVVAVAVEA